VPDARTIRLFRERIANSHRGKKIWKEIWKQFQEKMKKMDYMMQKMDEF